MKKELSLFFNQWAKSPKGVASILPSGDALALLITKEISPNEGKILELGPGTGVFTRKIIDKGIPEKDLVLVEYDSEFYKYLKNSFSKAKVLNIDAESLGCSDIDGPVGAVICGLGMLLMPKGKVSLILKGAFDLLKSGGGFYLFTYGLVCSVPGSLLREHGLKAEFIGKAYRNIPPASVYKLTKLEV